MEVFAAICVAAIVYFITRAAIIEDTLDGNREAMGIEEE